MTFYFVLNSEGIPVAGFSDHGQAESYCHQYNFPVTWIRRFEFTIQKVGR